MTERKLKLECYFIYTWLLGNLLFVIARKCQDKIADSKLQLAKHL